MFRLFVFYKNSIYIIGLNLLRSVQGMTAVVCYQMAAIFSFDVCNIYVGEKRFDTLSMGIFFLTLWLFVQLPVKNYLCPLQNTLNLKTEAFQLPKMADL